MTYFGFLLIFLGIPITFFLLVTFVDETRGRELPTVFQNWPLWAAILLHVVIAVAYTTLWDNYLVATRVWWYDPELVTGFTIGYVPIEEYTFFVVQPLLGGLWLQFLARRLKTPPESRSLINWLRIVSPLLLGFFWIIGVIILVIQWLPGNYLALELVWALPPIMLQLAFGADILWRYRELVLTAILTLTIYLSLADSIAIGMGTWTINPEKSSGLLLGGILPIEEFLFFLFTNTLVIFGIVLVLEESSHDRLEYWRSKLFRKTDTRKVLGE